MTTVFRVADEDDLKWVKTGIDARELEERAQREIVAALAASPTPAHWRPVPVEKTR